MALKKRYYTVNGRIIGDKAPGSVRTDYMVDHLGSVIGTSNKDGTVNRSYRYKPYGADLASSGTGSDPRFRWVGVYGYESSQLHSPTYFVRVRHMSSTDANWQTKDPTKRPQTYTYVNARPLTFIDPSGLEEIALQLNAFIPKRLGQWIPEPGPTGYFWEYRGDNRTFNQPGSSRIGSRVQIESCGIGGKATIFNNTGFSTRRHRWWPWIVESAPSTVLQDTRVSTGTKRIGGPCITFFHSVVRSAYPFLPPFGPTQIGMKGTFAVSGENLVAIVFGISHSQFPDFELLLKFRGNSTLLYGYATPYSGWSLIIPADVIKYFALSLEVETECCCTTIPCCLGECPCP